MALNSNSGYSGVKVQPDTFDFKGVHSLQNYHILCGEGHVAGPPSIDSVVATNGTNSWQEGSAPSFTVTTTGLPNGTAVFWTVTGVSPAPIVAADFSTNTLTGSVTATNNSATISLGTLISASTLDEGDEYFKVDCALSNGGTVLASSVTQTVTDSTGPYVAVEFVSGGAFKTGSNMTRYDTTSGDDQARGPWEFDRDGTEPYPLTWYMNGNAYDKIYWSTNGYMSFTSGHSSIESNVPGANDANGSIFGYYADMYQGYSGGYSSNGAWSQHGGGNGSSHGAWGMGTANYQIQWSPSNSPTWVQAWALAWCGTWYSGANRGKQASYTVIGVTDHQKQWIEVQYFFDTSVSNYSSLWSSGSNKTGIEVGGTTIFAGTETPSTLNSSSYVMSSDATGTSSSWNYEGEGRLRVIGQSNYIQDDL